MSRDMRTLRNSIIVIDLDNITIIFNISLISIDFDADIDWVSHNAFVAIVLHTFYRTVRVFRSLLQNWTSQ